MDDEPELRRMVAAMLEAEGFSHVAQAANVQEALAAYRQTKPELALLDVMLPDGDGFTLCQYLRAFGPMRPCPSSSSASETDDRLADCAPAPTTT
ncbi:MAG: response regulator [Eggerthellaceae bacterium]